MISFKQTPILNPKYWTSYQEDTAIKTSLCYYHYK